MQRWRVRVTSSGLISEVNHSERQRESPGWKISEREERHSQRKMRKWLIKKTQRTGQKMEDVQDEFTETLVLRHRRNKLLLWRRNCKGCSSGDSKITGHKQR